MYSLYINNEIVLTAVDVTTEPHIVMLVDDIQGYMNNWQTLAGARSMEVYKDGSKLTSYDSLILASGQAIINPDGSITAHYYMTGTTAASVSSDYQLAYELVTGGADVTQATAIRNELEDMAQDVDRDQKVKYISWFPEFAAVDGGYRNGKVIRFNGELYECLLNGNDKSPAEFALAWRKIDPNATEMDQFDA